MYSHLVEVSPSGASRFGIRIIHNTAIHLLFPGCALTERCRNEPANLHQPSTNRFAWACNTCNHVYIVRVPGLEGVYDEPKNGRPLDRWVAGFLGFDTDDVHVSVY